MKSVLRKLGVVSGGAFILALLTAMPADAQPPIGSDSYTAKIYHVNYGFYPIVETYIRTWGTDQEPLVNLNIANIGLQVRGRNYTPRTAIPAGQYSIETIERRREGFRTIIVLDCSGSMRGQPFTDAIDAINRFVEAKRPVDQVAILAIRDTDVGYEIISEFTNNPADLYRRLSDAQADGQQTRLYDTVAAALQMAGTAARGDVTQLDHAVLSTIVVLSDGHDEGSAITRSELINRIGQLPIPIPIHSIAFTRSNRSHLLNLEAISTATFGRYFGIEETSRLARTMENIHRINRSDYVVTFRAYVEPDGGSHNFRVGIEYPSGSGSFMFSSASFEAIESPAVFNETLNAHYQGLLQRYPNQEAAAFGATGDAAVAPSQLPAQLDASELSQADLNQANLEQALPPAEATMPEPSDEPEAATTEVASVATESGDIAADTAAVSEEKDDQADEILAMLQANAPLLGAAVVLLFVLVLAIVWVKKSSRIDESSPRSSTPHRTADPPRAVSTGGHSSDAATRTGDDWSN